MNNAYRWLSKNFSKKSITIDTCVPLTTYRRKAISDDTVYPKKYAHGFCFAVLCCGYTLTDFPISIRLTSLALWQSNDCPSASKATLMNMDKYFMWIHYERLHNHNKAKHNKTVCIFLGIYCISFVNDIHCPCPSILQSFPEQFHISIVLDTELQVQHNKMNGLSS